MNESYECIVIGGGPAGATVATLLADQGHKTLVLERDRFPRHHIGESLMPETYWTFQRLGMLDKMKATDFIRKQSVQFVSASGKESLPYYFTDRDPGEHSITWQVRRDQFDVMMLDNARQHGAQVRQGVSVKEVLFDGEQAVGVRAAVNGTTADLAANVVVDATGMSTLLARQLKLRTPDEKLRKAAIYAYYKGAIRSKGRDAGATLVINTPNRNGWFWFIPLCDELTSIGIVAPPAYLCTGRGDDPATTLKQEIENCPAIRQRLQSARQVSDVYVTSDFSYRANRMAGHGWVLVGDAFGFMDPIYSSGIMLAMKSGEFAADAIHDALQSDDFSASRLGSFADKLVSGMQLLRQLIYAFYDRDFSFGKFIQAYPEHLDHLVRLLTGDVFNDEVVAIFENMGKWVDLPPTIKLQNQ